MVVKIAEEVTERVRTHGWGGVPPRDDAEARGRILTAARARLATDGSAGTSDVAADLQVTRQTVYRYYPTTEALLNAAALDAIGDFTDDLLEHVRSHVEITGGDAGDALVEVVAYVLEHLREDAALNRLIAPGRISTTISDLTSPSSIAMGRDLIAGFPFDWSSLGFDDRDLLELVEHLLRTVQSLVLDPGVPERSPAALRAYLQRWLAPVVRATARVPS